MKDLFAAYTDDLGGPDAVSTAQMTLIRRAAVLSAELDKLDQHFANADNASDPKTLDSYGRAVGQLRRVLESLGLHRTPDMQDATGALLDAIANGPNHYSYGGRTR